MLAHQAADLLVIGGLMTSTVLSLVVIPVVFTFVDDLLELLKRLVRREPQTKLSAIADRKIVKNALIGCFLDKIAQQ
ncbi:MAG: hypothetical protein E5W83_16185 [Mesorhizobium sp.]|nr:MAG: hypothetical protein E5W83_16185 [Mesorhizobium sp.]